MKVIDLLNKIANGDKEIKDKYELKINTYLHCHYVPECLNDEVEITEEDKKIEKLELYNFYSGNLEMLIEMLNDLNREHVNKINEIIDYLEENK